MYAKKCQACGVPWRLRFTLIADFFGPDCNCEDDDLRVDWKGRDRGVPPPGVKAQK